MDTSGRRGELAQKRPGRGSEGNCAKTICVFLSKVARPTVSRARERPDPYQVRSLCTKVGERPRRASFRNPHGCVRKTLRNFIYVCFGPRSYTFRLRSFTFRRGFRNDLFLFHTFLYVPCKPSAIRLKFVFESYVPIRSVSTVPQK